MIVERIYGRTHYYPPAYDPWDRQALALLQRETAGDVVARSTLEWPLDRLVDRGLVAKRRERPDRVLLVVDRSTDVVRVVRRP